MLKLRCAPLDLKYDEVTQELFMGGKKLEQQPRLLGQIYDVLYDRLFAAVADQKLQLYAMYRGVAANRGDEEKLRKAGLKFDITIMPPVMLGKEYNKTFGHYHEAGRHTSFPELYEVLHGNVHFLLQKRKGENGEVEEVRLLKAKEGDKIVIPAEFGHIMINPSKKHTLITLNALERTFRNDYKPFIDKKGGAYYEIAEGFVANKNYGKPPRIKVLKPIEMEGFPKNKCLYRIFIEDPERFMFLAAPMKLQQAQPKPEEKH